MDGQERYNKTESLVAHYTLLSAERKGGHQIVCPNCGNVTTRENLLDGCDHCHTKFTVADLGTRVGDFLMRPDFEIQYAKYEEVRGAVNAWIKLIVGIPVSTVAIFGGVAGIVNEQGIFVSIVVGIIAAFIVAKIFIWMAKGLFWVGIFPLIQLVASSLLLGNRYLEERRRAAAENDGAEKAAKGFDPLFSLAGFFSNVQNKLATIYYANRENEVNAFALCNLKEEIKRCANVVGLSALEMKLDSFAVKNGMQHADVTALLEILERKGLGVKKREECKTKSVSTPAVIRCASLSILKGKTCEYCGAELNLPEHDWAIASYEAK